MKTVASTPPVLSGKLPPGPRGLPLFGSLLDVRKDSHLAITRLCRRYGDVCLMRFGSVPTVVISHPELLREAFEKVELADRWVSQIMEILTDQKDLVIAPYGEHWRQMQRFANRELLSARTLETVRERHIEHVVDALVERVCDHADQGLPFAPGSALASSNSTLMFRAIFGRDDDNSREFIKQRDDLLAYVDWIFGSPTAAKLADFFPWLRFLPNRGLKEAVRQKEIGSAIIDSLVHTAWNRPGLDLSAPTCLVEVMLSNVESGEITEQMTKDLCMDLMVAGIDTSAQTVNWFMLLIGNRPEVQSKIHEELNRVIGSGVLPTVEDRTRLPYLFACLAESMRFRTSGALGLPHKASADTEVGGYRIPSGTQVFGNIHSIHHDPRFWDSPDEFIPTRFLPQSDGSPSPALTCPAYIPFGTGHRRCPGRGFAETAVWLHVARLLHRLQFVTPNGTFLPEDEVFGLSVSPKPYELQVSRRW